MGKNNAALAHRAWNILRLALLWARKGGVFRRRLMMNLQILPNYLKNLRITQSDSIHYGEREFSFDETPLFHFKLQKPSSMRLRYLPRIPCLKAPLVDFDESQEDRNGGDEYNNLKNYIEDEEEEEDYESNNKEICLRKEEKEIDMKAEEFIAKFYEQMKMQRQVSHLQYNEMLHRGIS